MMHQKANSPDFHNAPVIETVLGVQFAALNGLTTAHLGWFWKQYLDRDWDRVQETLPLPDQFERFGQEDLLSALQFKVGVPQRLQISKGTDGRMIQIQPSRFHYNWNRVGGEYPRYTSVRKEFDLHLEAFRRFLADANLGEVLPNQWELTYIDSIPKGLLWQTPADWHCVLPGLFAPTTPDLDVRLESFGGEWHFEIPAQRGRVHVSVQLAKVGMSSPGEQEQVNGKEARTAQGNQRPGEVGHPPWWRVETGPAI